MSITNVSGMQLGALTLSKLTRLTGRWVERGSATASPCFNDIT